MPALLYVGVSALIVRDRTILLLRRRSTKDYGGGEWEPVSGRVEAAESAEDAVVRECAEETGLAVQCGRPFDTFRIKARANGTDLIGITFFCRSVGGEVRLSDEHDEYKWVSTEELLEMPFSAPVLACMKKAILQEELTLQA